MARLKDKIEYIKQYMNFLLSYMLDYPLTYPKELNFQMTNRCPLRCRMCNIPRLEPMEEELTQDEMKNIVDELKSWGIRYVSFVGGEALVRKKDTIELIRYCSSKGYHTTLISSGYFLNEDTCKELICAGINRVGLSLDGAKPETHDFIRGNGTFSRVIKSAESILSFRKNRNVQVDFTTVVMKYNFRELKDIFWLARKIGVDMLFIQSVVLDNTYRADAQYYDKVDFWINGEEIEELKEVIEQLLSLKRAYPNFIFNTQSYLKSIPEYFQKRENFNPGKCFAGYMGLNIDPFGRISVCGLGPNLNVRNGNIDKLWRSKEFKQTRRSIKHCRIPCMMLCYGKFEPKELIRTLIGI